MIDVSIILVNYNTYNLVLECIESIEKFTTKNSYEIIVVDNNSPDRSIENLNSIFPYVKLILNEENSGFGAGNNLGFTKAIGKYTFFLNSDTLFCNDSLYYFIDFFEKNEVTKKIGVVGSYLLDREEKINFSYGYFIPVFFDLLGHVGIHLVNKQSSDIETKQIDWVSGADMFIKTNVFRENIFDESFFMYSEEVDIQLRLSNQNYQNYIIIGPKIIHLEGGSGSKKNNIFRQNTIDNSRFHFYKKHSSKFNYFIYKNLYKIIFPIRILFEKNFPKKDKKKYITQLFKK